MEFGWLGTLSRARIIERVAEWEGKMQEAAWNNSAAPLISRMRSLYSRLRKKGCQNPEEFFFSIEDLPYFGKEYWFLHFTVPGQDEQVVITAGRSQGQVVVNKSKVEAGKNNSRDVDCAAVCWLYSGKKEVLIDSAGKAGIKHLENGHKLIFSKGENKVRIEGKYPCFNISLRKGKETIFKAKAFARKEGKPWEMPKILENPVQGGFGAMMVNYFFEFEGKMHGKKLKGTAYLQKVVSTMPLGPWNWVRMQFEKGGAVDFFTAKPLGDFGPKVQLWANGFAEIKGKRANLGRLRLTGNVEGGKRTWILSGKGIMLVMEAYCLQRFFMKQRTQFEYDEYLARVKKLSLRIGKKTYTLKELGKGSGIVEDAYGYLL